MNIKRLPLPNLFPHLHGVLFRDRTKARIFNLKRALRQSFILIVLILTAVVLGSCATPTYSLKQNPGSREIYLKLIAKSSESDFWKTVFEGAYAAAAEYNVEIVCLSPKEEDDYETQNWQISRAIEQGYDALILSACDYVQTSSHVKSALDSGMTVISIDSPIDVTPPLTQIGTDNIEAGRTAARAMIENMPGQKIIAGIINFEENSGNGVLRQQGFLEEANLQGIDVVDIRHAFSNIESPRDQTLLMLEEHPDINAIVTFNEWTTIGVGEALRKNKDKANLTVIGFDANSQSIEDLETDVFDALIVQNPFAMGYLGVVKAIENIQGKGITEEIDTGTKVITKQNMYNPENQKLVFPFS